MHHYTYEIHSWDDFARQEGEKITQHALPYLSVYRNYVSIEESSSLLFLDRQELGELIAELQEIHAQLGEAQHPRDEEDVQKHLSPISDGTAFDDGFELFDDAVSAE